MHEFIKPEETIALDEVARRACALLEACGMLVDQLPEEVPGARLACERTKVASALERLTAARQQTGELPVAGDLERAQWHSLGLRLKSLFGDGSGTAALARALLSESDALAAEIAAARRFALPPDVADTLQDLAERVADLAGALRIPAGISAA